MRRIVTRVVSVLLSIAVILPFFYSRNVEAAASYSERAKYVSKCLYNQGDYVESDGLRGYSTDEDDTKHYSVICGTEDGSQIVIGHHYSSIDSFVIALRINTDTMTFEENNVLGMYYDNSAGITSTGTATPSFDVDPNRTTNFTVESAVNEEMVSYIRSLFEVYYKTMLKEANSLLHCLGVNLGFIGFTNTKFKGTYVESYRTNRDDRRTVDRINYDVYVNPKKIVIELKLGIGTSCEKVQATIGLMNRPGNYICNFDADIIEDTIDPVTGFRTYKAVLQSDCISDFDANQYVIYIKDQNGHNLFLFHFIVDRPELPAFIPGEGGTGVEGFVNRLYSIVLNREGDSEGQAYWINNLRAKLNTGGDVARLFLTSSEFEAIGYSDEQFVEILYRVFFNRSGDDDSSGMEYWLNALNNGATRNDVITGFINSNEWATLCASYLIESGGTGTPAIPMAVYEFATGLYSSCLGRSGDSAGIEYWANLLYTGEVTGTSAAREFFRSEEFLGLNLSKAEYISRLYKVFMMRDGTNAEITYWVGTRLPDNELFFTFASSEEFRAHCQQIGINP